MRVHETDLPGVLLLDPVVHGDERGFFLESYNRRAFADATGVDPSFVQDNHSRSAKGVLRGLHYQVRHTQGKLVRVVAGRIFDVAVDVRASSPTLGHWTGAELTAENHRMLWIPAGFAHGFLVLSDSADVLYKTTDVYDPEAERTLRWDDPEVGIVWPVEGEPILSAKDGVGQSLSSADLLP